MDINRHFARRREGDSVVMTLAACQEGTKPIQNAYAAAIQSARGSVYITNAYFIPDRKIFRALSGPPSESGRAPDAAG